MSEAVYYAQFASNHINHAFDAQLSRILPLSATVDREIITMLRTILVAGLLLAPAAAHATEGMPHLDGEWRSMACELRPQAGPEGVQPWYLKRLITFSDNRIDAHFTTYADATCSTPLVELKFGGDVKVLGPSDIAPGAMEVDLTINDYLRITPRAQGFAGFLNSAEAGTCGAEWSVGVEQDIHDSGCSVMGVAAGEPIREYEVLMALAGRLYFGARPVDGKPLDSADKRPTTLQLPLVRVSGGPVQTVGAGDMSAPTTVEIVQFQQRESADPGAVARMLHGYTPQMNKFGTLLYRTIAHDGEGGWTCVNYWTDLDAMKALNADAQSWPSLEIFPQLVDMATFRITNYAIETPPAVTVLKRAEGKVRIEVLDSGLTMHTYRSNGLPGGIGSVNSHIFESADGVILIDTQMYQAAAEDVCDYVLSLGKPVERIIISHAHPDHGFGYAYMTDLGPASATASVITEAKTMFPVFGQMMTRRMGEMAAQVMPIDDIPEITEALPLGAFTFGGATFEVFEMPTHEVGTEMFIRIPEHRLLMVFDAIMPDAHQLVVARGKSALPTALEQGFKMLDALAADTGFDRILFGHGLEPGGREQLDLARESLTLYGEIAEKATSDGEFISLARQARPDWKAFYVPMTAGMLFPAQ